MCKFFSFLSDAKGNYYYADWKLRTTKEGYLDSHSWLAQHFLKNGAEDHLNCYEFNPLTKSFTKDKINIEDDSVSAEKWANEINWKRIIKPLIIKPLINPLKEVKQHKVTQKDIRNLKKCIKIPRPFDKLVWHTIMECGHVHVEKLFYNTLFYKISYSVRVMVHDSLWLKCKRSDNGLLQCAIVAYISSFFDIKYKYDFSPFVELWERGFVPSFDEKKLRLHQGEKAKIVFELTP